MPTTVRRAVAEIDTMYGNVRAALEIGESPKIVCENSVSFSYLISTMI